MNKKKTILLVLIAFALTVPAMAKSYKTGVDNGAGKTKIGAFLGSPLLGTVGFESANGGTELNIHAGLKYGYSYYNYYGSFIVGANFLFTIANIDFGGGIFPMAIGPQVDLHFGGNGFGLDVLAVWRWEYTFWFPLNLYVQFGGGVGMDFYDGGVNVDFAWTSGVGVRYVFGM